MLDSRMLSGTLLIRTGYTPDAFLPCPLPPLQRGHLLASLFGAVGGVVAEEVSGSLSAMRCPKERILILDPLGCKCLPQLELPIL